VACLRAIDVLDEYGDTLSAKLATLYEKLARDIGFKPL
jgi:hypothetical protein